LRELLATIRNFEEIDAWQKAREYRIKFLVSRFW
jgi:hypothetical protein